jgi:hypothetical protein
MNRYEFQLHISSEAYLDYYRGANQHRATWAGMMVRSVWSEDDVGFSLCPGDTLSRFGNSGTFG